MKVDMPEVVSRYLDVARAASAADADRVIAFFTEDAEVLDEGQTRRGHDEIRSWWMGAATVFDYTVELLGGHAVDTERYVVLTRLRGNFPGGTADLANRFTLRSGRIARLEIAPPTPDEDVDVSQA